MPDPDNVAEHYSRMTPAERKRHQERTILSMVYDLTEFIEVTEQERPDFTLRRFATDDTPFGIEITQMFPNQSIARLNLLDGYMDQLFQGGPLRHRDDTDNLTVSEVSILDKDGVVKQENLTAILAPEPTRPQFRLELAATIRAKTGRRYSESSLSHLSLVILDWFHLASDLSQYAIDTFLDEDVVTALLESPFREVYLITYDTSSASARTEAGAIRPQAKIAPLQQLLLANRFFVTASAIDSHDEIDCTSTDHLSRLTSEHIVEVQQIGSLVQLDGLVCAQYRGSAAGVRESGMVLYEFGDFSANGESVDPTERFTERVAADILESVRSHTLNWGYARDARSVVTENDDT